MHYVYILESISASKLYIGVTNNLRKRFYEHNNGLSRSTAPGRPYILKRVERFENIKEAYSRERFLKSRKNRRLLERIIRSSPDVLAEREVGIPILPLMRQASGRFIHIGQRPQVQSLQDAQKDL